MNIEIDSQKLKKIFTRKNLGKIFFSFLFKKIKFVVLFVSLGLLVFCIYIWHVSIYAPDWNEAKKQEYIKGKDQGIALNKPGFKDVVSEYELKKTESEKALSNLSDIFKLKN